MRFARDTIGLDFTAITDSVNSTREDEWRTLLHLVKGFTEPGKFAALAGFEFYSTEKPGRPWPRLDRNVIFRNADVARLPLGMGCDDYRPQDSTALFDAVDLNDALIVPHQHPGGDWQALHNRSCYATTRARIIVKFSVNGAPMGSEIHVAGVGESRKIEAEIYGTTKIEEINVIRNGQVFAAVSPDSEEAYIDLVDEDPLIARGCYYYLKVKQTDGNIVWASPVWVDLCSRE